MKFSWDDSHYVEIAFGSTLSGLTRGGVKPQRVEIGPDEIKVYLDAAGNNKNKIRLYLDTITGLLV